MVKNSVSRRGFLAGAAATAGWTIVPRRVLGRGAVAPSDQLNIGVIGAGGRGWSDIQGCKSEHFPVLCDIDFQRAARAVAAYPDARQYADFREMLDAESDNLDAVIVATPDHTHAVAVLAALEAGKHVFCEKPLTRTIAEARAVGDAARKAGVATQMGNQGHAGEGTRLIREWIEAGVIGEVSEVHYWTNRPIWPQAIDRPKEAHHPPAHVDWDLWLGPMPNRPFHPDYYHPFNWRGWWDFGTGAIGDIACHAMDAAFWAFDLRDPSAIWAESTKVFSETAPASTRISYAFPKTDDRPELKVVWRDGGLAPGKPKFFDGDRWPTGASGQLFMGTEGVIVANMYATSPRIYPTRLHEQVTANPVEQRWERTEGHYKEWIEACKKGTTGGSNFHDHAGPMTEMALLGNLAVRSGQEIQWDPKKLRVSNGVDIPGDWVTPDYRPGWSL